MVAVSEFVLAQILSVLKKSYEHNFLLKNKQWKKLKGKMLSASQFGFIGYGKIGRQINLLIKPFKCNTKIYDPFIKKYFPEYL